MKKRIGLFIACSTLILGISAVIANQNKFLVANENFSENVSENSEFEDEGPRLALSNGEDVGNTEVIRPSMKVQVSEENESGCRSIRFIAAISSLNVTASFDRVMYSGNTDSVLKESKSYPVTTAYASLEDGDDSLLPSSFGEEFHYFITYTMNNIPEANFLDVLDVTVHVNNLKTNVKANVGGTYIANNSNEYLTYEENKSNPYEYTVDCSSDTITEAYVNKYYAQNLTGYVADDTFGKVTTLYRGIFDACRSLTKVVFPDSITTLSTQAFRNCASLREINIPENVTGGADSLTFYGLDGLKIIHYDAINMKGNSASFEASTSHTIELEHLYIGSKVQKIPDKLFPSDIEVEEIRYDGSKTAWQSVDIGWNDCIEKNVVICNDSKKVDVTFHFQGKTLSIDGTEYTDQYVINDWEGTKVPVPQAPLTLEIEGTNYGFKGWYKEEGFSTKLTDSTITLAEGLNYYANYAEIEKEGFSVEEAIPLTVNVAAKQLSLAEYSPKAYYIFSCEEEDIYYINDVDTSTMGSEVTLYDVTSLLGDNKTVDDGELTAEKLATLSSLASNNGGNNINETYNYGLGYRLEADHTYVYVVGMSSSYGGSKVYDTTTAKLTQIDGDRLEEADQQPIAWQENKDVQIGGFGQGVYCLFDNSGVDKSEHKFVEISTTISEIKGSSTDYEIQLYEYQDAEGNYEKIESSKGKTLNVTTLEKKKYVVAVVDTHRFTASREFEYKFNLKIDDQPKGLVAENAIVAYENGEGLGEPITIDWTKGQVKQYYDSSSTSGSSSWSQHYYSEVYYSFTPKKTIDAEVSTTGLSSSTTPVVSKMTMIVYEASSKSKVAEFGNFGTRSDSKYYCSPTSFDTQKIVLLEANKEYIVQCFGQTNGTYDQNPCKANISFTISEIKATSKLEEPHELLGDEFNVSSDTRYAYQYTGVKGYTSTVEFFKITIKAKKGEDVTSPYCNVIETYGRATFKIYSCESDSPSLWAEKTEVSDKFELDDSKKLEIGKTYIIAVENYTSNAEIRIRFKYVAPSA